MSDILVRDMPEELKRQIEDRARAHKHSLSREITTLLRRSLSAPQPTSEYGLGTELSQLVPPDLWDDEFIQPREQGGRPPPNFE